jgi:hypothetical protein
LEFAALIGSATGTSHSVSASGVASFPKEANRPIKRGGNSGAMNMVRRWRF